MTRDEYFAREDLVRQYLDEMLDASIEGDYKEVRKLAKKINKLSLAEGLPN